MDIFFFIIMNDEIFYGYDKILLQQAIRQDYCYSLLIQF